MVVTKPKHIVDLHFFVFVTRCCVLPLFVEEANLNTKQNTEEGTRKRRKHTNHRKEHIDSTKKKTQKKTMNRKSENLFMTSRFAARSGLNLIRASSRFALSWRRLFYCRFRSSPLAAADIIHEITPFAGSRWTICRVMFLRRGEYHICAEKRPDRIGVDQFGGPELKTPSDKWAWTLDLATGSRSLA